jgi:hypothetical protein
MLITLYFPCDDIKPNPLTGNIKSTPQDGGRGRKTKSWIAGFDKMYPSLLISTIRSWKEAIVA